MKQPITSRVPIAITLAALTGADQFTLQDVTSVRDVLKEQGDMVGVGAISNFVNEFINKPTPSIPYSQLVFYSESSAKRDGIRTSDLTDVTLDSTTFFY